MRKAALALVLLAAAPGAARAADIATMAAAASGFYGVYAGFHPSDGIPDASARTRLAPFLSDRLAGLLAAAARADTVFSAAHKDAPPLLEGDLFTSLFEGATAPAQIGACTGDARTGRCLVALHHEDTGQKAVDWTDTVILVNTAAGWRIDDIAYGGRFSFGNGGRLSETLATAMADAHG